MQKIRKKYQTVKAVGPELTHQRTHPRTDESEFIGSFRSLKTSGEPKKMRDRGEIIRRVLTLGGGWYPKPSTTSSPRLIAMVAHIGFNNILLTVTFADLRMSKIWHHFFY